MRNLRALIEFNHRNRKLPHRYIKPESLPHLKTKVHAIWKYWLDLTLCCFASFRPFDTK